MSQSHLIKFCKDTGEIKNDRIQVLSVSDLNSIIKQSLEGQFPEVWLKGEISNLKAHSSGHFYFSVKDQKSQISAVMFRGHNLKLKFRPKDGDEVLIQGRVSVYEPRGAYQIYAQTMEPLGAGALQKAFEDLKVKLSKEGLFDSQYKKPLPLYPKKIALITSPTGAAVRDMIQVLGRRYKAAEILLIPALTQGAAASASLVKAVQILDDQGCDVAIIGRGGGSIEDLWGFNDETLARTIHTCKTPLVSAVGHEIDVTICDFVCDLRAPTPSAAAELVSQSVDLLTQKLMDLKSQMHQRVKQNIQLQRARWALSQKGLIDPQKRLQDLRIYCDDLISHMNSYMRNSTQSVRLQLKNLNQRLTWVLNSINTKKNDFQQWKVRLTPLTQNNFQRKKERLISTANLLESLNPLAVLNRGYSIVKTQEGSVVCSSESLKLKKLLNIQFGQGQASVEVTHIIDPHKREAVPVTPSSLLE